MRSLFTSSFKVCVNSIFVLFWLSCNVRNTMCQQYNYSYCSESPAMYEIPSYENFPMGPNEVSVVLYCYWRHRSQRLQRYYCGNVSIWCLTQLFTSSFSSFCIHYSFVKDWANLLFEMALPKYDQLKLFTASSSEKQQLLAPAVFLTLAPNVQSLFLNACNFFTYEPNCILLHCFEE